MRKIACALLITMLTASSAAADSVYVEPYTRDDGTFVEGHLRSEPDGIESNNLGPAPDGDGLAAPSERDFDGDGLQNNLDMDSDGDGTFDNYDSSPYDSSDDSFEW